MSGQDFHEQYHPRESKKSSSDRSFGFVFTILFAIIGLAPLVFGDGFRLWALFLAAAFLIISTARPRTLSPLNLLWTKFGLLLHRIVSPMVMALLFFSVVTPIGLLMRGFGKRPLNLGFDHETPSYFILREPPGPAPETMKQQF
jgi:hypothetical protein